MLTRWSKIIQVLLIVDNVADLIQGVRFITEPSDMVAVLHQSLLWNCMATDDSSVVDYSWRINSATLPLHDNQVIFNNGSLLLQRVTYDDVGLYMCLATAGGTTLFSRAASLNIAYINSTFTIQPVSQTAVLGDHVVLSCYIKSLPPAYITWTLDGANVTKGEISRNSSGASTLSLHPVMYYHVGTYKCVGSNPLTGVYRYSNDGKLVVQGQPVFLSSLEAVSVPIGFHAKFVCYFHGNPEPKVTWFMHRAINDDILSKEIESSETTSQKYTVFSNGTLIIKDVRESDEAYYTCTAGNLFGEMSESARLTVTGPAVSPEFTLRPSNNTVQEGYSVTFLCTCSGNPEPSYTWKKESVEVSENSSLSINNAQSENIGWYTCYCENAVGTASQSVYLDVYTQPLITQTPEEEVSKIGEPLFLHCSASGNPIPSITWLTPRFGSVLTSMTGLILYSNGTLHISSVTLEDSGEYTCLARNIVGMMEASFTVSVQFAPKLTQLPLSQGVKVGSKVFLHCQATGMPDPVYSWSKDGEGMIIASSARQIYLNNTLVIHSVTKEDEGVYRCLAGNNLGVTHAVATVTVTVPPNFTIVPNNKTVHVGSTVQLRCMADGYPVPTQRWTKDDRQLPLEDNIQVSLDQTNLTIFDIRPSQYGKYTCIASNIAGSEYVSSWINIYDLPEFSVVPSDTVIRQSATLSLLCQGQAIETPSVTWYKGREGVLIQLKNDIRVTVTENGLLQIEGIDWNMDEGWYTCIVKNAAGAISKEVFVDVQVPPKILSTNNPQSTTIQSQVTLTCQSTGDPIPSIQWITPSGNVISPGSAYQSVGNVLIINSLRGEDVGNWTCKYCNSLGCDSAYIEISVEGMPTITSFTGSQDGSLITFECTVDGNPEPSVMFSYKGQMVTSALQGHTVKDNRMMIETMFLKTTYRCVTKNVYGISFRTISVPSKMKIPVVSQTNSRPAILSWDVPGYLGNLPLLGYSLQKKSDLDLTWQSVEVEGHDILNKTSMEVPGLEANREYTFRMAASNLLGLGEFSEQTHTIFIKTTAPSEPENVLALEIGPGIIVVVWKKSQYLNAPIADVVYEYKIFRQRVNDGVVKELIHRLGTVLFNETLQVRVDDLTVAAVYKMSLWARNVKLNVSSRTITIVLDNTAATYLEPGAQSDIDTFGRDKLIGLVVGCVGGIILVIIIVCIVTRVRAKKKTKTLSLLDHTLSLDQFYMENPKTLHHGEKYNSKRKSGHSFYSFDESFQSTVGSRGRRAESVEYLGSNLSSDVLLVAKSPLYKQIDGDKSVSYTSSRDQLYDGNAEETACIQSEIQLPNSNISLLKGASSVNQRQCQSESEAETNLSSSDRESVSMEIEAYRNSLYCEMKGTNLDKSLYHSYEHIHSSIHNGNSETTSSKKDFERGDKSGSQKRPLIVFSSEKSDNTSSETAGVTKDININKLENGSARYTKNKLRTRSASPEVPPKGSDSFQPKPPVRVLSLDLLNPAIHLNIGKDNDMKIFSEKMFKDDATSFNHRNITNKDLYVEDIAERSKPSNHIYFDGTSNKVLNEEKCNSLESLDKNTTNMKSLTAQIEHNYCSKTKNSTDTNGETCYSDEQKQHNQLRDNFFLQKPKPKNVIEDNFLNDSEIKEEISSAGLY